MGSVKLYYISKSQYSTQFIISDYPGLEIFQSKQTEVKRLNVERYFKGINKDYKDYNKIIYGPVFGTDDPRNGFIYEHKQTEEMIIINEDDIPVTYAMCDTISGDLISNVSTDTNNLPKGVITDYTVMTDLQNKISNKELFVSEIKDMWILDRSFLIIE